MVPVAGCLVVSLRRVTWIRMSPNRTLLLFLNIIEDQQNYERNTQRLKAVDISVYTTLVI